MEYAGLLIDCIAHTEEYKVRIIGCDKDIGLTIVKEDDHKNYLLCLIGPSSSLGKDMSYNELNLYHIMYEEVIRQINSGTIVVKDLVIKLGGVTVGNNPRAESCPFGQ